MVLILKQNNEEVVSYVIQERVKMPYSPRKKTLWEYNVEIPNVGNDGTTYNTMYYFKIVEPTLTDIEREFRDIDYKVEPLINVKMRVGKKSVDANIRPSDFFQSSLGDMVKGGDVRRRLVETFKILQESIAKLRYDYKQLLGTDNIVGTVQEGDKE